MRNNKYTEPALIESFNRECEIPCGVEIQHIQSAMTEFLEFLEFINTQLATRSLPMFEMMLMPANFSSIVGEFMKANIPKYCKTVIANQYHNGHPDLIPVNRYANDAVQHGDSGIEIKGSRYLRGWQGHNPEKTWLMIFAFDSSRQVDSLKGEQPRPFKFLFVGGAALEKSDWTYSGRSETSRRTITASVNQTGFAKIQRNWIYRA